MTDIAILLDPERVEEHVAWKLYVSEILCGLSEADKYTIDNWTTLRDK